MLTDQMMSLLTSCHIRHVCLHYKCLFYSGLTETTINKAVNDLRKCLIVWMHAFRPMVDILSILR